MNYYRVYRRVGLSCFTKHKKKCYVVDLAYIKKK